ncbi:MAG: hypothetical protein ACRCTJ_02865 [Brevinema sp.]
MKYFFLMVLFLSSCTQSFISYVKTVPTAPIISVNEILVEAGIISENTPVQKELLTNNYPSGTLLSNNTQKLKTMVNTLEVEAGTAIKIEVDTENYLIAQPYFFSEQIIQDLNNSNPTQGIFEFMIGNKPGMIKIRLYHPNSGKLIKEVSWHIEIKNHFPKSIP